MTQPPRPRFLRLSSAMAKAATRPAVILIADEIDEPPAYHLHGLDIRQLERCAATLLEIIAQHGEQDPTCPCCRSRARRGRGALLLLNPDAAADGAWGARRS